MARPFRLPATEPTRALRVVPGWMWGLLVLALLLRFLLPLPGKPALWVRGDVGPLPPAALPGDGLRIMAAGDAALAASLGMLWLQAIDQPPGQSLSFRDLNYAHLGDWLDTLLFLRPAAAYPLLAAIRVYGEVADPARQRQMIDFTRAAFQADPGGRWHWQAHAVFVAQHRLGDAALAFALADELTEAVRAMPNVPAWARQLDIFVRAGMGEREAAAVLLGALLQSGQITDARELAFLKGRLRELGNGPATEPTPVTE